MQLKHARTNCEIYFRNSKMFTRGANLWVQPNCPTPAKVVTGAVNTMKIKTLSTTKMQLNQQSYEWVMASSSGSVK